MKVVDLFQDHLKWERGWQTFIDIKFQKLSTYLRLLDHAKMLYELPILAPRVGMLASRDIGRQLPKDFC